jgi:hypothetical protein
MPYVINHYMIVLRTTAVSLTATWRVWSSETRDSPFPAESGVDITEICDIETHPPITDIPFIAVLDLRALSQLIAKLRKHSEKESFRVTYVSASGIMGNDSELPLTLICNTFSEDLWQGGGEIRGMR